MPSTSNANIHARPSSRNENIRPICGNHAYWLPITSPRNTAGVSVARMTSPPNGAAAADHAVIEREVRQSSAVAAAITNGSASRISSEKGMQGTQDSRAGQRA